MKSYRSTIKRSLATIVLAASMNFACGSDQPGPIPKQPVVQLHSIILQGTTEKAGYSVDEAIRFQCANQKPYKEESVIAEKKTASKTKIGKFIREKIETPWMMYDGAYTILIRAKGDIEKDISEFGAKIKEFNPKTGIYTVSLPAENIGEVSKISEELGGRQGIDKIWSPPIPLSSLNLNGRIISNSVLIDTIFPDSQKLDGSGVNVMVYDVGYVSREHPDLADRVVHPGGVQDSQADMHPTHVACSLGGTGVQSVKALERECEVRHPVDWAMEFCEADTKTRESGIFDNRFRGVAPGVKIFSEDHGLCDEYCVYETPNKMFDKYKSGIEDNDVYCITSSIGPNVIMNRFPCEVNGSYDISAELVDEFVHGDYGDSVTILFAAGNERADVSQRERCFVGEDKVGFHTMSGGPASSKNAIVVGATMLDSEGNLVLADYGSLGPDDAGRVKPTVVNYGGGRDIGVLSCYAFWDNYISLSGTSMATPLTAGVVALMVDQYRRLNGTDPSPGLIKAIIVDTAAPVEGRYVNYMAGFGQVDASDSILRIVNEDYATAAIDSYTLHRYSLIVKPFFLYDKEKMTVTMGYSDLAGPELINDLDMELISPSGKIYLPHVLDPENFDRPATRGVDARNTLEKITMESYESEEGVWQLAVKANELEGSQQYSLTSEYLFKGRPAVVRNNFDEIESGRLGLFLQKWDSGTWNTIKDQTSEEIIVKGGGEISYCDLFGELSLSEPGYYRFLVTFNDSEGLIRNVDGTAAESGTEFYVKAE
ncbi:MAG: S8 family serine peptidase [archaeon]